jgi:hypothetical protein
VFKVLVHHLCWWTLQWRRRCPAYSSRGSASSLTFKLFLRFYTFRKFFLHYSSLNLVNMGCLEPSFYFTTPLCESACGLTSTRITSLGSEPITAALVLSQHNWMRQTNACTHIDKQPCTRIPSFLGMTLSNPIPTFRGNVLGSTDPTRLRAALYPWTEISETPTRKQKSRTETIFRKICIVSQGKHKPISEAPWW